MDAVGLHYTSWDESDDDDATTWIANKKWNLYSFTLVYFQEVILEWSQFYSFVNFSICFFFLFENFKPQTGFEAS